MKRKSAFFKRNQLAAFALALVMLVVSSCTPSAVGALDPTFGTNGIVTVDLGSDLDSGKAVLVQPDGRIVMLASAQAQTPVLMRFNANGSVDSSFGVAGKLSVDFGYKGALQSDGKLLVAGFSRGSFAVARYDGDGTGLDTSFGTDGVALIPSDPGDFNYHLSDLILQPDRKIVVVGTQESQGHTTTIAVARFTSEGMPDTSFNERGLIYVGEGDFPDSNYFYGEAVAIQPDGKIVVSGDMLDNDNLDEQISLARLNPDGSLDAATFGTNGNGTVGIVLRYFKNVEGGLALQRDGNIVVAGTVFTNWNQSNDNLALARFNTNGTLDPAFGGSGIVTTDLGLNENAEGILIQADGKIVVVGKIFAEEPSDILLVRYNSDGSLDNRFGENGKVITDLGEVPDSGNALAIQKDRKLVVTGSSNGDALLARYR